ncbi:MAG TPA: PepSY-associated TM helix domain-containing protein [Pedobacter sp.]|uniref:PepSY-associated TM helix domain-containing protein n=1 Tax=Pedobacter sp. TaxID=1411316 RepID=UPI002BAC4B2B|nr:PepSY-associated TM helix domain-containing protein [Pedobacter sp.]HMI04077.1 PepSY-associated TM helix domain-containing protein [Pedobacter sp.]
MVTVNKQTPAKKKSKISLFNRVNKWLHLWLGLISGIIVLIVCLTGCIWVFHEEIEGLLEPETKVERQDKAVLTPSQLSSIAFGLYPDKVPAYANYQQGRAINLTLRGVKDDGRRGGGTLLKINPYTGEVISKVVREKDEVDFFRFILNGHRFLWMPYEIGRPIVNYGTLVFVVLLITGLIWWYPKKWNKSTTDKSFKIKWGASFKRVNLDLHNVLGFYSLLFLLAIALSGMVYGIKWYSEGLYWVTSGGEKLAEYKRLESDSLQAGKQYTPKQAMDLAWNKVIRKHPMSMGFYYNFPDTSKAKTSINITVYPTAGQFYNSEGYTFDQHTLKELKRDDVYSTAYAGASFSVKLRKMNYDIHVGSILGFPGKVMAFLASLIGASLPVTGFLIWYGRKFKKKKGKKGGDAGTGAVGKKELAANPVLKPKLRVVAKEEKPVLAANARIDQSYN